METTILYARIVAQNQHVMLSLEIYFILLIFLLGLCQGLSRLSDSTFSYVISTFGASLYSL